MVAQRQLSWDQIDFERVEQEWAPSRTSDWLISGGRAELAWSFLRHPGRLAVGARSSCDVRPISVGDLAWSDWIGDVTLEPKRERDTALVDPGVEREFRELVERWRGDNLVTSSVQQMVLHPAYQRIIGFGRAVLPLLLREMRDDPDHWFWALRAITGEDAAQPGDTFDEAVARWVAWGRARQLIN